MRGRGWLGLVAALALVAAVGFVPPASAGAGREVTNACTTSAGGLADIGRRACKSLASGLELLAATCRRVPGLPPDACRALDDRDVSEAGVARYEASWVHRALGLQRRLDDGVPLLEALMPHTHNSFNAPAYAPTVSNLDPNQLYTVTDQLRMDMRGIELDLHWHLGRLVVCHGQPVAAGPVVVHAGCSVDRGLPDFLAELRRWLDAPANGSEVLLLYLENNLDGVPAAHDVAAAAVESALGGLVLRPPANQPCAPMPLAMSRDADTRASGARVLIVGNCGPGAWGSWVYERGPQWDESSSAWGEDYPADADCAAERAAVGYDTHWIRRYEDSTWLSAITGGGSSVNVEEMGRMVRCGVNMPGFDQLRPDDPRLAALVWSWAPNEPAVAGCAYQGADGRFRSGPCAPPRAFACRTVDGAWAVTATTGPWSAGPDACAAAIPGSSFAVPANGWQNRLLREAAPAGAEVWLAYSVA